MYTPKVTVSKKSYAEFVRGVAGRDPSDEEFQAYVNAIRDAILGTFRQIDPAADLSHFQVVSDYEGELDTASDRGMMTHLMSATLRAAE